MKAAVLHALSLTCVMVGVSCFASTPPRSVTSRLKQDHPRSISFLSASEETQTAEKSSSSNTPEVETFPLFDDTDVELLDDALRFNSTAASELLSRINAMRKDDGVPQEVIESYLNSLLELVDTATIVWWTRSRLFRRPLTRFSRRACRASLGRVLELSMPVSETQQSVSGGSHDEAADMQRRRRSLVVLLRTLADNDDEDCTKKTRIPAIARLEIAARREAKQKVQAEDMVGRLPEGLETPKYSVIVNRKGYEIRNYEPFSVCSVAMNKPRPPNASETTDAKTNPQLAGASSFGALAGYLFGKNKESTAMKMTTPVLSAREGEDRQMSFVLPSEFWSGLEEAPKPLDNSGVILEQYEGEDRAVVMFGGFAGKKDVEDRKKQLMDSLAKDKEWIASPDAAVTLAQYNDPFTPPWKRRNEVSVKVVRRQENENVEPVVS